MYDKGVFHPWVSRRLQVALSLIIIIPLMISGGIYTANISLMYAGLGEYQEAVTFANYAAIIGMIIGITMLVPVRMYFRPKEILIGSLFALAFFNILVSRLSNPFLITLCSFFMGFFKMFGMIALTPAIMAVVTPTRDRALYYSFFYPIIIGSGQIGAYLTADLAYNLNWRYVYIIMSLILLGCALLAFLFIHNKRQGKQIPIKGIDWISLGLLTLALFTLDYMLVYAKQQDWFNSDYLKIACCSFVLFLSLFILRQHNAERPMMPLENFLRRNVVVATFLIFMMGLYLSTSTLQLSFFSVLNYNSLASNLLNLSMVPGIILGGALAFQWFKTVRTLKPVFLIAFAAFLAYAIMMYFLVSGQADIRYFIIPLFFKGLGMCLTYIGAGFYFAQLPPRDFLASMPFLIVVRSFISVALFTAVISWGMNHLQMASMFNLTAHLDASSPFGMAGDGGMALYPSVKTESTLVAVRKIFGYIVLAGMVILIFILSFPFRRMHRRKLVVFKKAMMLQSTRGYRTQVFEEDKEIAEVAGAAAP